MLQIGSIKFKSNIFLASLAGCTDLAFRLIAREHGADFCFYEMSDSNSLYWADRQKTADMHQVHPDDLPIAAQLLGSEPDKMLQGAIKLLEMNDQITFLDINAACPVNKVVKKRAGAYLLKAPELLYGILRKLSDSLPLPLTVKLRTGYSLNDGGKIIEIAKRCEQSWAKALFVHGRTRVAGYSGDVDYQSIRAVKESVSIPVFGSGDVFTPQKAKEMFDKTSCDGILVARGAFGNPWIFRQIKAFLDDSGILPEPSLKEKVSVLIRHLQYLEKYKMVPLKTKLGLAHKVAAWYLRGFADAAIIRNKIARAHNFAEIDRIIKENITSSF